MTALIVLASSFIISSKGRNSGEYFTHYNQSNFEWSGSVDRCTLSASYSSAGNRGSDWRGCQKESVVYESLQEFDLTYSELLAVCPSLLKVPESERGTVDESPTNKYLLPDKLVWSKNCSATPGDINGDDGVDYCPRWQCDNSSLLWDRQYNASFTFNEISTLTFSSNPLKKQCWECRCKQWSSAVKTEENPGAQWVWTCAHAIENPGSKGTWVSSGGLSWTVDPIDDSDYDIAVCGDPTSAPTAAPSAGTDDPTAYPTREPTPSPTDLYCEHGTHGDVIGSSFPTPGDYYWRTPDSDDCSVREFCYCQESGEPMCAEEYADIMGNSRLYYGFVSTSTPGCGEYISDCWRVGDADRLFDYWNRTDPNQACDLASMCPVCGCSASPTDYALTNSTQNITVPTGGVYNYSVAMNDYEYTYDCLSCECILDLSPKGLVARYPIVSLDYAGFYSFGFSGLCGTAAVDTTDNHASDNSDCEWNMRQCYSDSGQWDADEDTIGCSVHEGYKHCSFETMMLDSSPDEVCTEEEDEIQGKWGCGPSWRCDQMDPATMCVKADFDYKVMEYDCIYDEWLSDTYKASARYSCCNDEFNCNNRTREEYMEDQCDKDDDFKALQQYEMECQYSQKNIYDITDDENLIRAVFCGETDLNYYDYYSAEGGEDTERLCPMLKVYWQWNTFCNCNQRRLRIAQLRASEIENKYQMINDQIIGWHDGDIHSEISDLIYMYQYWGCDEFETDETIGNATEIFSCDLDAEVEEINNKYADGAMKHSLSLWTVILTVFAVLFNVSGNRVTMSTVLLALVCSMMYVSAEADYDWTQPFGSTYGVCEFAGSVSTNNDYICEQVTYEKTVYQGEGLTWDILVKACPNLRYAGCWTEEKQMPIEDLYWPQEADACDACPKCPCTNETDTYRWYTDTTYNLDIDNDWMVRKTCKRCRCVESSMRANEAKEERMWWLCGDRGTYEDYEWKYYDDERGTTEEREICEPTPVPTAAPTPDFDLLCMEGLDYDNLSPITTSRYGKSGVSHCGWWNMTRERYEDGEPAICVSDEVGASSSYFSSTNTVSATAGWCQALVGDSTACLKADFNMDFEQWDCARDKWITDKYKVEAAIWCCNDGDACNNQTITNDEVSYMDFQNETQTVKCNKNGKFESLLRKQYQCPYTNPGLGDDYVRDMQCNGGVTDRKPGCSDLEKFWKYKTRCDCSVATFFLDNLNETFDWWQENAFNKTFAILAHELAAWNATLGCGWKTNTKWFCNAANVRQLSVFVFVSILVAHFFVSI